MDKESQEIDFDNLKLVVWKTNLSRRLDQFREVINNENVFKEYFGVDYVSRLSEKSHAISIFNFKLYFFYVILMIFLYSAQSNGSSEFEFFGYGFKNIGLYKEFLLLLAALILPVSTLCSAYQKYIDALADECIAKMTPNKDVKRFYRYNWFNGYSDSVLVGSYPGAHGVAKLLVFLFALFLVLLIVLFFLASSFVQINVVYDVAKNPASPGVFNYFVVFMSTSAIFFSWLITIIQLPMPERDYSAYSKVMALEKINPEKYKEVFLRVSREVDKQESINSVVVSSFSYFLCYMFLSIFWFDDSMGDVDSFLLNALLGSVFVIFMSGQAVGMAKRLFMRWFFNKYSEESTVRYSVFKRINLFVSLLNVIFPSSMAFLYVYYSH